MSGDVALKPAKKPTPNSAISNIEINLLYEVFISLKLFLSSAFFILPPPYYHSISSIGVGFSFIIISSAVPFLNFITLSAIGAIAPL